MTLEEELQLEEAKHRHECWRQTNRATIDSGIKGLASLFLLNGAAATALLAQQTPALCYVALVFAFAALWTIAAFGAAYLLNLIIAETWRIPHPGKADDPWIPVPPWKRVLSETDIARWRVRIVVFSTVPAVLFLVGLILAGVSI
jgi:hypothetical protein